MAAAAALPLLTAALTAGAAAYTGYQQYKAGKKNEALERAQTAEEARRLERQQEANLSEGRARAAASGTRNLPGGSQMQFLEDVEKEQGEQLSWLKQVGSTRAGMLGQAGTAAGIGTAAGGLASAGAGLASSNWWSTR